MGGRDGVILLAVLSMTCQAKVDAEVEVEVEASVEVEGNFLALLAFVSLPFVYYLLL